MVSLEKKSEGKRRITEFFISIFLVSVTPAFHTIQNRQLWLQ